MAARERATIPQTRPFPWLGPASSEPALARLAVALGAAAYGGPLAAPEQALIAAALADAPPPDPALIATTRAEIRAGADPLGATFCALRSARRRRGLGAFYTSSALVRLMIDWALDERPTRLVDPGCGSGRFAVAAARARPDMEIIATDLDPLATLLTRAALAVVEAPCAQVVCGDYLALELPPAPGRAAFVANPPDVRHHDLSPWTKQWAADAAREVGIPISGLAGLHVLFYVATARLARAGDVGCFVTSAEWLDTRYGAALRRLLLERLGMLALAVVDPRETPFADAMTTAAVVGFRVGQQPEGVLLQRANTAADLMLTHDGRGNGAHEGVASRLVPSRQLAAASRWSPLLPADRQSPDPHLASAPAGEPVTTLGQIVRVSRGIATGGNGFFVMERARAQALGLLPWCHPVITRAHEILTASGVVRDTVDRKVILMAPADIN